MKKISKIILCFVSTLEKHLQTQIPRSVFRNSSHKNKIRLFSISVKLLFRFLYKTMTKQTVYLHNFARKSGFRLQFLRQSSFKTQHCWRGHHDLSNNVCTLGRWPLFTYKKFELSTLILLMQKCL